MTPITVEGVNYPHFFSSPAQAMEAAYNHFKNRGRAMYGLIKIKNRKNRDCYVVQNSKGGALALTL